MAGYLDTGLCQLSFFVQGVNQGMESGLLRHAGARHYKAGKATALCCDDAYYHAGVEPHILYNAGAGGTCFPGRCS